MKLALRDVTVFRKRTITSLIAIPVVVALIWLGPPWFTIFAAAWGMGAAFEFYRITATSKGLSPLTYFGMVWAALLIVSPHIGYPHTLSLLLTGAVILPLVYLLWRKGKENAFANWGWTLAGIFYVGWLLSYMVGLRILEDGREWVVFAVGCTFASDISAYLAGKTLGRHKLAPYISPNKTWEGAAAGVAGSIVVAVVINLIFNLVTGYFEAVLLGALVSVVGQVGDLIKSLFKRNTGIKDSGTVIPGHGGFLDRTDSMAFAGVTVYLYVNYLVL